MLRAIRRQEKLDFPFATINIILLLLFFFIVTGSIVGKNETSVAPPVTSRLTTERLPRPLLVIDKTGSLYLDEVATGLDEAIARMREAPGPTGPRMLNVIADRDFSAERFLDVVDTVRKAGIPIRIVTLHNQAGG